MENYIDNRSQAVRIGNNNSKLLDVTYGVSQGSILASLLFIIFVNELSNLPLNSKLLMYADDLLLYVTHSDWNILEILLSSDINLVYSWSCCNRLSINFNKSKLQIFCNKSRLIDISHMQYLSMGNNKLLRLNSYMYLRVAFSVNRYTRWDDLYSRANLMKIDL